MSMSRAEKAAFDELQADVADLKEAIGYVTERPHLMGSLREKVEKLAASVEALGGGEAKPKAATASKKKK